MTARLDASQIDALNAVARSMVADLVRTAGAIGLPGEMLDAAMAEQIGRRIGALPISEAERCRHMAKLTGFALRTAETGGAHVG